MTRKLKALRKAVHAAQANVAKANERLSRAWARFEAQQRLCPHKHVDRPGSVFGETCLDCGLYLNNGG